MVPYLEIGGFNGFLFRNLRYQRFHFEKWVVPMAFCLGTEGSRSSLLRNGWFQCFSVKRLKVPMVPFLEMGVSHVLLYSN